MIQRIQTVYLLLAAFVTALPVWLPYASFSGADGSVAYTLIGSEFHRPDGSTIVTGPVLMSLIMIILSGLVLLTSVFLFKNRKVQLATVYSAVFSEIVLLGTFALSIMKTHKAFEEAGTAVSFNPGGSLGLLAPLLAVILIILAARGIKKDEALVRSADRIR